MMNIKCEKRNQIQRLYHLKLKQHSLSIPSQYQNVQSVGIQTKIAPSPLIAPFIPHSSVEIIEHNAHTQREMKACLQAIEPAKHWKELALGHIFIY